MIRWATSPLVVAVGFALLVLLTQTGQITTEVLDWDESTFILLASRLLDGHLPYVDLYDNKPPLIFFALAGWMAVFGETLFTVRLFGDLCILAIALLTVAILRQVTTPWPSILAGVLLIAACATPPGQHTSSELPATAMILCALYLLLSARDRFWAVATAGLLISLATLTRSNLGAVAVVVGVYLVLAGLFFPTTRVRKWAILPYTIAGLIPVAGFLVLYWQAGALETFFLANVTVPLSYSDNQNSIFGVFWALTQIWAMLVVTMPLWAGVFTGLAIAGTVVIILSKRGGTSGQRAGWAEDSVLIQLFAGAMVLSVLISGAAYPHYLLQVFPFAAMLASGFITTAWRAKASRLLVIVLVIVSMASALRQTAPQLSRLITGDDQISQSWTLRQAAERIDEVLGADDQVWTLRNHLILWYLDRPPVSPIAAHPSNVNRPSILAPLIAAGYVSPNPLQQIYDRRPAFLVTEGMTPEYLLDPTYFATYLSTNYTEFFRADGVVVYRRLGH